MGWHAASLSLVPSPDALQTLQSFLSPGRLFFISICALLCPLLEVSHLEDAEDLVSLSVSNHHYSISSPSSGIGLLKLWGSFVQSSLCSEYLCWSTWPQCLVAPIRENCGTPVLSWYLIQVSPWSLQALKSWLWFWILALIIYSGAWQLCLLQFKLNSRYYALLPLIFITFVFWGPKIDRNWLQIINVAIFTVHKCINIH